MLVDKEAQLVHFQDLWDGVDSGKWSSGGDRAQVAEVRAEMVKKESAWETENFELE